MKLDFRKMALAIVKEYKLMDSMCSPYPEDWELITEKNKPEIKWLIDLLEENSGLKK